MSFFTFSRAISRHFFANSSVCAAFPFFTLFISLINASLKFEAAGSLATFEHVPDADAVRVQLGDGVAALNAQAPGSADVVRLGPPLDAAALFAPALAAAARAVQPQGLVYLEAPTAWDDAALVDAGLAPHRHPKAGAVHAHLLRPCA